MVRISGVYTPITTPFGPDDAVDLAALRRNVRRWLDTPLRGLVVLGSNGEAALLDEDESDAVIDAVRAEMPASRPLIAGTGRESTRATIAATRRAAAAGVDAVLVRTPSFFKAQMNSDAFVEHYTRVADASPVPVLLYNVTMFTGVNLQPDAVERLSAHPNVHGLKESGSDMAAISDVLARVPPAFGVLAGSATTFLHALCAGCHGGVLALASLAPAECVLLTELVRDHRLEEARDLQRRLVPLARLVGGANGVPALKAALDLAGYEGGRPRSPLRPVSIDLIAQLGQQIERLRAYQPQRAWS